MTALFICTRGGYGTSRVRSGPRSCAQSGRAGRFRPDPRFVVVPDGRHEAAA